MHFNLQLEENCNKFNNNPSLRPLHTANLLKSWSKHKDYIKVLRYEFYSWFGSIIEMLSVSEREKAVLLVNHKLRQTKKNTLTHMIPHLIRHMHFLNSCIIIEIYVYNFSKAKNILTQVYVFENY